VAPFAIKQSCDGVTAEPSFVAPATPVLSSGVLSAPGPSSAGVESSNVPTFVLRLIAPRPNFAQTLTDSEREIMTRHAAYWSPYLERGDMVVFGPVLTDDDSYGLAVVETDDEQALRAFAAQDPVVTTGTAAFELGRMAAGHVRAR
jgi:uncharacterized protein